GLLLRREFVLAVVHDLADRRTAVRRDLDKIHSGVVGHPNGFDGLDGTDIGAVGIDQLDLQAADSVIHARPVLGGGRRSSVGTANGKISNVVDSTISVKHSVGAG